MGSWTQQHILTAKAASVLQAALTDLQPAGVGKRLFRHLRVLHSTTVPSIGLPRGQHWTREPENRMKEKRLEELTLFSLKKRRLKSDGSFAVFNYWMALYTENRDRGTAEDKQQLTQHQNFLLAIRKKKKKKYSESGHTLEQKPRDASGRIFIPTSIQNQFR